MRLPEDLNLRPHKPKWSEQFATVLLIRLITDVHYLKTMYFLPSKVILEHTIYNWKKIHRSANTMHEYILSLFRKYWEIKSESPLVKFSNATRWTLKLLGGELLFAKSCSLSWKLFHRMRSVALKSRAYASSREVKSLIYWRFFRNCLLRFLSRTWSENIIHHLLKPSIM